MNINDIKLKEFVIIKIFLKVSIILNASWEHWMMNDLRMGWLEWRVWRLARTLRPRTALSPPRTSKVNTFMSASGRRGGGWSTKAWECVVNG